MTPERWTSSVLPWDQEEDNQRQHDLTAAWQEGDLSYKLDPNQQGVYDDIRASHKRAKTQADRIYVLDIGRQYGKDTIMVLLAHETAIRTPGLRIPYGAPTRDEVVELLYPITEWLLQDCPPHLRPQHTKSDHSWTYPNGSRIVLVGCDLHPDRLRGPGMGAGFLTEAGFMGDLNRLIGGVLLPQMIHFPDSFMVWASTPPETPAHPWSTVHVPRAVERGMHAHRTIEECPRLLPHEREAFVEAVGGKESTRARREFYAEHIIEESLAIVPEYAKVEREIIKEWPQPQWFDGYCGFDPGFVDYCGLVWGYWDFVSQVLVIEREICEPGLSTGEIADAIKETEHDYWGNFTTRFDGERPTTQPYLRVSDCDKRLIHDLLMERGISFMLTAKDHKDVALAEMRTAIGAKQIIIHPRCVKLQSHLKYGVWNEKKTDYQRVDGFGHFDLIPALMYLYRNVSRKKNPCPPGRFNINMHTHHVTPGLHPEGWTDQETELSDAFGGSKRRTRR